MTPQMAPHSKRWQLAPPAPHSQYARFPDLDPILVQVLYNRGLTDPLEVSAFLNRDSSDISPFRLRGIHKAVTRLRKALRSQETMAVYGDFDADGVTATALMVQTLRALGGKVRAYIPHRVDEGYGLNTVALEKLHAEGVRLVVTVDCGVRSVSEVAHAGRLGLDVIITDHHSLGPELPAALAIIDPKRLDSTYPFKYLAGAGVAFKLAQGLLRSHQQAPVTRQSVRLTEEDLIDLVALGTVADLAPLVSENRTLVHRGLECLNRMERPGLEALCRKAGLKYGQVDATSISYSLGPRMNAAGRMSRATVAYDLLQTEFPAEAERLADELDHLNRERRKVTLEMESLARGLATEAGEKTPLLFAADPRFRAGIVGLVASRLLDEFYRPAVVVEKGKEFSRGSARSIPEFHITDALDQCSDLLVRHGGHAAAAGFTVSTQNLDSLATRLMEIAAEQLSDVELRPVLPIDAKVDVSSMSWGLEEELGKLEPCGCENQHPAFLSENVRLTSQRAVGNNRAHLKLTLRDGASEWDAIAFRQGERAGKLPDRVDVVYRLEVNEWNNRRRLQLNVADIRPAARRQAKVAAGARE